MSPAEAAEPDAGSEAKDGRGEMIAQDRSVTSRADGALELLDLRRCYGDVVALDGLSFGVPAGKVFGFLGPNGAGKTTAMRAVVGVVAVDSGEVRWRGALVDARARRTFGYMPEERGLYPGMIVLEQLEYLGRLYGMSLNDARDAARQWTARLGVEDKQSAKIETLSQGNQQRVQLAAALVHEPELLILDEPFAGLDPVGVDEMSTILAERAAAGATVLFSSHQLDLVQDLCEAVAIIHRGRLVAEGSLAELRRGGEPRLAVRVAGDAEGRWAEGLAGTADVVGLTSGTVLLALSPGADAQLVLDAARAAGPVEHFAFAAAPPVGRLPRSGRLGPEGGRPGSPGADRNGRRGGRDGVNGGWLAAVWLVAARELRQGTRARSFRVVTLLLVLTVAAAVVLPAALRGHRTTEKVGIVGGPEPAVTDTVRTAARVAGVRVQVVRFTDLGAAESQLRAGTLAAVLVGGREVLVDRAPAPGTAVSGASLSGALALVGGLARLSAAVPAGTLSHGVNLPIRGLKPPLTDLSVRLTGLAMTVAIYMIILLYGSRITVGVSEEKSSRVVEVLLAAVSPAQLLFGKVLGLGILALVQALAIVVTFVALGALVGSSLVHSASLVVVAVGALWIVVGYAFYCTAYAAAGSLVSKPSDAYNASLPVQLPLILSYILTFTVLYGNGVYGFYWFLAFFPPTAPISMTVLVAIGAARPWEVALSVLLCLAATVGMAWAAGTIYGRAILHSGARLKWRQALRRGAS